jgi:N4-(beta-N-acetylglucosaminyl)-L-asparaginase
MRIVKLTNNRGKNLKDIQVGFIALNKKGEYGSYCVQGGFNYAVLDNSGNILIDADFYLQS